jgi:hypothetical protein
MTAGCPAGNVSCRPAAEPTGGPARTVWVRIVPSALLAGAVTVAATACGGGSPASPTFTPATPSVSDDAGSSPSLPDGASADDIAAAFARCPASAANGTFPADVAAVLGSKCQTCHNDPLRNGAPFPLLTFADVHGLFDDTIPIFEEMYLRIQPGAHPHMPFGNAPQLTTGEFTTLSGWLISCAPSGG